MKILSLKLPYWILILIVVCASVLIYQLVYHYEIEKINTQNSDKQMCSQFKGEEFTKCIIKQQQLRKEYETCHKLKTKESCEKQNACTWMQCKNGWDPQAESYEFCTSKDNAICLG